MYANIDNDGLRERFWQYLMERENYGIGRQVPEGEREAFVLFMTLDYTFDYSTSVKINGGVVQYMAAWCHNLLQYGHEQGNVVGTERETNYFVRRTFEYFFYTIRNAIFEDKITQDEDGYKFGYLLLPEWLVEPYKQAALDQKARERSLREEHPDWYKPYLRTV